MKQKSVKIKAYCKINIALNIKGIREDGFHEVEMIMQTVPLYDIVTLSILPAKDNAKHIELTSDAEWVPLTEKNTAFKAARMLTEDFGQINTGTRIHIEKKIPGCGGLGGSSADAAAVLLGMNLLYELGLSLKDLQRYGAKIGADVPFLLKTGAAIAIGTGTELKYIEPLRRGFLLLVNRGIEISTPEAYRVYDRLDAEGKIPANAHPDISAAADIIMDINTFDTVSSWTDIIAGQMKNVLEYPAFYLQPQIAALKKELFDSGAKIAMMSGSGGTVFGIFSEEDRAVAERAQKDFCDKGFFTFLCSMDEIDRI